MPSECEWLIRTLFFVCLFFVVVVLLLFFFYFFFYFAYLYVIFLDYGSNLVAENCLIVSVVVIL